MQQAMNSYTSFYFDNIELSHPEDRYIALDYDGSKIEIDIDFDTQEIVAASELKKVDDFLSNLKEKELEIRSFITSNFQHAGIVRAYIETYTEEFETYELEDLVDTENKAVSIEEQLLSKLYIYRIGFYPGNNWFAVFDFHINHEISDQILVVIVENDMSYRITWES